jgi:hypothetical protein
VTVSPRQSSADPRWKAEGSVDRGAFGHILSKDRPVPRLAFFIPRIL